MAIRLQSKPNVTAPNGTYPFGDIKDNPGDGSGTPVNRLVYGDFHQFFANLLFTAGITGNDLPENSTNTFQYIIALQLLISNAVATEAAARASAISAEASARTSADNTLQSNINSETASRIAADSALQAEISGGSFSALTLIGGWGNVSGSFVLGFKTLSDNSFAFRGQVQLASGTGTSFIICAIPPSILALLPTNGLSIPVTIIIGGVTVQGYLLFDTLITNDIVLILNVSVTTATINVHFDGIKFYCN